MSIQPSSAPLSLYPPTPNESASVSDVTPAFSVGPGSLSSPGAPAATPVPGDDSSVRVCVRVRPMLPLEQSCAPIITHPTPDTVRLGPDRTFTFDHVQPESSPQAAVFATCVRSLVDAFIEGYNATVLAYGQTGSGKTYTMGTGGGAALLPPDALGIVPRVFEYVFREIAARARETAYSVHVTFLEIYGEEIHDLLAAPLPADFSHANNNNSSSAAYASAAGDSAGADTGAGEFGPRPESAAGAAASASALAGKIPTYRAPTSSSSSSSLSAYGANAGAAAGSAYAHAHGHGPSLRETPDGRVLVLNALERTVASPAAALAALERGSAARAMAPTRMNETSSRSHAIFTLHLTQKKRRLPRNNGNGNGGGASSLLTGSGGAGAADPVALATAAAAAAAAGETAAAAAATAAAARAAAKAAAEAAAAAADDAGQQQEAEAAAAAAEAATAAETEAVAAAAAATATLAALSTATASASSTNSSILSASVFDAVADEVIQSKFHFVDLAGSERLKRTGAQVRQA